MQNFGHTSGLIIVCLKLAIRNLPQTKTLKIISYSNTFLKCVQLKCGRDFQYPTRMEKNIEMWKEKKSMEFFFKPYRNLPQR